MAAPAVTNTEVLTSTPFVITKLTVTSGATATAIAHGGPSTPFHVTAHPTSAVVAGTEWNVTAKADTTITMDFADDGNDTWEVVCWFLDQDAQDGNSITVS